ncbi:MAG: hypothetical protein ACXAC7_11655 [Candidatus Hodarchaeales archaeon]|jgi:hypothetical protein
MKNLKIYILIIFLTFFLINTYNLYSETVNLVYNNHNIYNNKQNIQDPSIRWLDDYGNQLVNNTDLLGPHANITVLWNDNPDQVNLLATKGKTVIIQGNTTPEVTTKTTPVYLVEGDKYKLNLSWDSNLVNLGMYITNHEGEIEEGCNRNTYLNHGNVCPLYTPDDSNTIWFDSVHTLRYYYLIPPKVFIPKITGWYNFSIWTIPIEDYTVNHHITLSNYEILANITSSDTSITMDTSAGWNGNFTFKSNANYGGIIKSSILRANITNWFPSEIHSLRFDGIEVDILKVNRSQTIEISWVILDPNREEDLRYDIHYKHRNLDFWSVLDSNLNKSFLHWNITNELEYPEGKYQLRVAVYDGHFWIEHVFSFELQCDDPKSSTQSFLTSTIYIGDSEAIRGYNFIFLIMVLPLMIIISKFKTRLHD